MIYAQCFRQRERAPRQSTEAASLRLNQRRSEILGQEPCCSVKFPKPQMRLKGLHKRVHITGVTDFRPQYGTALSGLGRETSLRLRMPAIRLSLLITDNRRIGRKACALFGRNQTSRHDRLNVR